MALIHELKSQGDTLFRHRSYLPIIILIPALLLYLWNDSAAVNGEYWSEDAIKYTGLALSLFGLLIRVLVIGYKASKTSGRNTDKGQVAESLNKTGLYSQLRHPLYLGNFFMWAGPAVWTKEPWFILFFIAAYWIYYERIMFAEEAFLRDKFGNAYDEWSVSVPAFIPRMRSYISHSVPFNWRKVIRNEKNGLLGIFLVFCAFDALSDMIQEGPKALEWNFWSLAALSSLILYLFAKAFKKTRLLRDRT